MATLVVSDKERFKVFEENITWFRVNYGKLKKEHPDKFVAINKGKVIASDKNLDGLLAKLRHEYDDITTFAIEFVSGSEAELILI